MIFLVGECICVFDYDVITLEFMCEKRLTVTGNKTDLSSIRCSNSVIDE